MSSLGTYFDTAVKAGASDIHLVAGEFPMIRVEGVLTNIAEKELTETIVTTLVNELLSSDQRKAFEEKKDADVSYEHGDVRFRVNVHSQDGKMGIAARIIPKTIPTPEQLRFEPVLLDAPNLLDGLVLVVGPTGHGKSTTIASMIEEINKTRKAHIMTIEDPIEFVFEDKESLIEQREIGIDTPSFASALKHVLRQDPDVVVVGEMRDPETIATVLTAAETGHLVFSTLHTSSAAEAIERIVDVFEGAKQKQVLIQLSAVLRVVVSQQLIPTVDGKRVVAREILINTPAVSNLIRENNIAQIGSVLQTNAKEGMISIGRAVEALEKEGLIDEETAKKRTEKQRKA
ncbi:MAG: type IV pili twitching motility protein PilT [Candidatus Magasanikbacteria bacterium CG_4_9_14_0_2_um_filter_42_11]|uniref:Type IV pili twitching motility protein PilT n=1 Tax=Candidatus Magasanikbacteria bacterium CG_4_9_14_0_2_um_filter_42_11 TaxID=1974643 RepID=A0A2M8F8D8_9BACT|nr:MAG: type IV pili twitching motility protein PilT [Candidatus Magasanikbacteria bacterium CG10_big_fil_rev_8_21_14_0_10_43_9]PIY92191.1 MAG: type IV pili twitching motility protein PilT [Candidatus Magasanikbacteria bacterium CG_4_10_14_0_8_um_filter_42_12]PJC52004.1 MAG: type IV pili twitching motility protein PilT [Candidatus Magasanikbacteria bacterium CG_4_9_14_0_2_um_filter_42_11]